jgi:hypothetical protein
MIEEHHKIYMDCCSALFKILSIVVSPLYTGMYKEIFNFIKKYQNDTIYF